MAPLSAYSALGLLLATLAFGEKTRPHPFRIEKEGTVMQSPSERSWLAFQAFARSHEDEQHRESFKKSCSVLGLDDGMYQLSGVDASRGGGSVKRVLFLTTVQALFFMTDRWYFHMYLALAKKTERYNVLMWGVGLPGFHYNETLAVNMKRWFVDPKFDVVITTWNYHRTLLGVETWKNYYYSSSWADTIAKKLQKQKARGVTHLVSPTELETLRMQRRSKSDFHNYDEATREAQALLPGNPVVVYIVHEIEPREQTELRDIQPHVVMVHLEQHLGIAPGAGRQRDLCGNPHSDDAKDCQVHPVLSDYVNQNPQRGLVAYMPNALHDAFFLHAQDDDPCDSAKKTDNVLLVGAMNGRIYPLRGAAAAAKRSSLTNSLSQYVHPGYKEELEWTESLEDMCHVYYRDSVPQQRAYVEKMRRSRLCLVGSRNYNAGFENACPAYSWALRKYVEAMAAGCVVIGDPPSDHDLARYMPLRLTKQKPLELGASLDAALAAYKASPTYFEQHLCRPGRRAVLANYTYSAVIDSHFTPALIAYQRGQRGLFQSTRSPFMVRNDDLCVAPDGSSFLVGNASKLFAKS